MARQTQGRIFKRGKKGYYYVQYYLNGKQIVKALRDENNKPITGLRAAQKAANIVLAPYKANDEIQRRQQAIDALKTAEDKARDAELAKNAIKISDAHFFAMQKPRRRKLSDASRQRKAMHWSDFSAFMEYEFPETKTIEKVTKKHAEKYIQFLIEKGKFNKTKTFKRKNKTSTFAPSSTLLSPRSVNAYLVSINEIFNLLASDGGYIQSPFSNISKQKLIQDKREAFSLEELRLIAEDGDDFILPLFTIGLCTGLREADICLLEWQDVDLSKRIISRITRKTGAEVKIPIMPPLESFLDKQLIDTQGSKYVLPEHADMYLTNPSGITWRVKRKLEQLGIKTTKIPEGRSRAVSIKDVHSLRHSFCYYAGLYNVPLAIVQSVVGHMSPEMTKHYTMHATTSDIKKAFENIPDIFGVLQSGPMVQQLPEATELESERKELIELVHSLPLERVREILSQIKK